MKTLVVAAIVLSLAAGSAFAQDDPLQHYDAYLSALDAGDYARASQEGEAAWRAAEAVWGEDGDTGLLAFTLAQFRVNLGDVANAAEPARRALALAGLSPEYSEDEARLLVGVTMAPADAEAARAQLQTALAGLDAGGAPPRDDIIVGRLKLAMLQVSQDPEAAVATAQEAVANGRRIASVNMRTYLSELGKVQYLTGHFADAAEALSESLDLWSEQPRGVMPALLANTYAWRQIAQRASMLSGQGGPGGPGGRAPAQWGFMPSFKGCDIEFEEVEPAPFPAAEGDSSTLGAAVVMYDLDEDGAATNIRIVGAAPDGPHYEDFIIQRVGLRKARRFVRESCRTGMVETFTYDF